LRERRYNAVAQEQASVGVDAESVEVVEMLITH
jgi:hypothetical protein